MTDQTQRLEIATVKAEVGSNILSRFSNDAINADGIPTDSGAIPNLKQVIKSIEDKASVSTSIYPTVAAGLAATAEGGMFLVASADTDEIYEVWRKVSGAAVDTGKRALSSQAAEDAVTAAQASAEAAAAAAGNAAEQFQDIFEADQLEREAEFRALMDASGYESVYLVYGPGVVVNRQTQLVQKDGELYRVTNAADLPLTLTGTWSTDAPKLMAVGDAALRQSIESAEGYDLIGATLPTGVVSTVKGFFNWILDRITLSTSGSASIVAAVAKGGKVVIKNGGHYMSATAQCDYGVEPIVGFPGHESKRFDVAGETMGGTILSVQHSGYALFFSGSYLPDPPHVTQNLAGFDSVSNLTLVGASVTAPNTTDTGGFGLLVRKKAYTSIRRIAALNLRIGLHLDGVLSSTVEDYTIEGCYAGAVFEDFNSFSGPNGMHFRRIKIGGSTDLALRSDIGAAMNFDNLTIENCGVMPSSRFVATFINQPGQWAGSVNYMSSYCENNAGHADYNFENNSTHPLVINMNGSMFQRNSPSRYTGVNIRLNSTGGGRVTMKIGTTSFLSSLGYVPSASRPFFIVGANCEVIWDESCAFSETTSLAYWLCLHRAYSFSVAADGTILSGPDGFACTALGGGIYRFYRTSGFSDFAKFADDYSIHPSSTDVNVYISVVSNKTSSYFDITMSNNVTGVNAKFDVTIRRNKGYYS